MAFTNLNGIDISLAVWLLHDDYDFSPQHNTISATGLLKPTRQIILARRLSKMVAQGQIAEDLVDISSFTASRLGHAIHDSVEHAWLTGYKRAMRLMNIPEHVIERFKINPSQEDLRARNDIIPVYIEQRGERSLGGFTLSGKLDMSIDGRLKDIKSTSVWTYILGRKDEDYQKQMSIYRWIHRDIIKDDEFDIQFVFTDWSKMDSFMKKDYPKSRILSYTLPLLSLKDTENFISRKIQEILDYSEAPEEALPRCTDEELWRSTGVYKYFSDPTKTDGKSTKNFETSEEANQYKNAKGKGVVIYKPGVVRACSYCRAFSACKQKDEYSHD